MRLPASTPFDDFGILVSGNMAIEAITGILDCFIAMFYGWRFVVSKSYRTRKLKVWRSDYLSAIFEILLGLFGIALTIGLVVFAYFILL